MSYSRKEKMSDVIAIVGFGVYGLILLAIIVAAILDIFGVKL